MRLMQRWMFTDLVSMYTYRKLETNREGQSFLGNSVHQAAESEVTPLVGQSTSTKGCLESRVHCWSAQLMMYCHFLPPDTTMMAKVLGETATKLMTKMFAIWGRMVLILAVLQQITVILSGPALSIVYGLEGGLVECSHTLDCSLHLSLYLELNYFFNFASAFLPTQAENCWKGIEEALAALRTAKEAFHESVVDCIEVASAGGRQLHAAVDPLHEQWNKCGQNLQESDDRAEGDAGGRGSDTWTSYSAFRKWRAGCSWSSRHRQARRISKSGLKSDTRPMHAALITARMQLQFRALFCCPL